MPGVVCNGGTSGFNGFECLVWYVTIVHLGLAVRKCLVVYVLFVQLGFWVESAWCGIEWRYHTRHCAPGTFCDTKVPGAQ